MVSVCGMLDVLNFYSKDLEFFKFLFVVIQQDNPLSFCLKATEENYLNKTTRYKLFSVMSNDLFTEDDSFVAHDVFFLTSFDNQTICASAIIYTQLPCIQIFRLQRA
jgi:hypothetical protein